jgi:hypothetical protein
VPHAPDGVEPSRIGRISMVDAAVLKSEGAHSWPFAQIGRPINSSPKYILGFNRAVPRLRLAGWLPGVLASEVVFDPSVTLLLLRTEADAIVGIEVAANRRRLWEGPSQPTLIRLQL